jgi:hypothetical protein
LTASSGLANCAEAGSAIAAARAAKIKVIDVFMGFLGSSKSFTDKVSHVFNSPA